MYETESSSQNSQATSRNQVKEALQLIQNLNPEDKAHIISRVIVSEPSINIVFENISLHCAVVFQINLMNSNQALKIISNLVSQIMIEREERH